MLEKENSLELLLNPASVATAGANNNPMKMGTLQALSIIKDGFPGKLMPIHPQEEKVLGWPAWPSVAELPETPDLAMLVVPPDQVVPLMGEFGKIGTPRAIIISAGFKETGHRGYNMEKQLEEISQRYGIRFLGPNCMGVINTHLPLNVTVATYNDQPGKLGMISQSGTYVTQTLAYLRKRGIRFSKAVSVGNEGDIDTVEALEYLGKDEHTRAIALYLEGLKDGEKFLRVAREITPHKPIIAQYVGGSEAGARASMSHTGAMAGPDELVDGLFKQAGILRVDSIEDLYTRGWVLATQPVPRGNRVGVITNSGGPGTAMSHTCNASGMEVPAFSEKLQEELKSHLEPHAASGNPVDLTFHLDTHVLTNTVPEIIMKSGEVDAIVLHGAMGSSFRSEVYPHIKELIGNISLDTFLHSFQDNLSEKVQLPGKYGVPMVISSFFGRSDNYTAAYQDNDIPVFDSPEKTAWGLLSLHRYRQVLNRKTDPQPHKLPSASPEAWNIINEALEQGRQNLNEFEAKKLLSLYQVPVTEEELVATEEEAVEASRKIGFPVVVKGCSSSLTHKTEKGLVFPGVNSEEGVLHCFKKIKNNSPEDTLVLISQMVQGKREFMAGMTRFKGFGPAVLFGLGGILTEALQDTTMRLAPLNGPEAEEMIYDIKSRGLLGKYRGMPEVNIEALKFLLQAVGNTAILHPQISELDLNPVIISGSSPVVVDALIVVKTPV